MRGLFTVTIIGIKAMWLTHILRSKYGLWGYGSHDKEDNLMDCAKIGQLIARLRKEKGLTQQNIAMALGIQNKTVSKWECGLGCPDINYWSELSVILGIEVAQLMEGEITANRPDTGNISRIRFYVCPSCFNVLTSTGAASIFCCGRKLEQLKVDKGNPELAVTASLVDIDTFVTIDHPMHKDHYMLFGAYVSYDKVFLTRMYPEQNAELTIPHMPHGKLYLYCTLHGLTVHDIRVQ